MFRVPPAPAPYLSKVRLLMKADENSIGHSEAYVLHGFEDYWVVSHAKIIIRAPNLDFITDIPSVGEWEFIRKPVDVVEVTVRLILVFLLELFRKKLIVVEVASVEIMILRANGWYWSGSHMKGTATCRHISSSRSGFPG